jgi:GDP-L-fucose synthase
MELCAKIYVAGHRGLVGSALVRALSQQGYQRLITRTHAELDLTDADAVKAFFAAVKPDYVLLAAAKVGGILANNTYPVDFLAENLKIQTNVIEASYQHQVKRLLFLGSSCIYPRACPQPIKEQSLLTGPLEATNRPYALAKIAGIELCWAYNRQYGTQYLAAMPTNLYGPNDNYHLANSHVIPALIRKMHEAKLAKQQQVTLWGSGTPRREFMYSDDLAQACLFLLNLPQAQFQALIETTTAPLINIGVGSDLTIKELALKVKATVGYQGTLDFDSTKPDGTPQKLLDIERLSQAGWRSTTTLDEGLNAAYQDFMHYQQEPVC